MRSLVDKEFHRMIVDVHFEDEVGRSAELDLTPHDATPSWWEWISVSSRSSTSTFLLTRLRRCLEMGDSGEIS